MEGERWREVCSVVLESIICLNRMNDDNVNMKFGRLNHCLSDGVGDCLSLSPSLPLSLPPLKERTIEHFSVFLKGHSTS